MRTQIRVEADVSKRPRPEALCQRLRAVIRQYEGPLLRYALRITGQLERAQDIVQETFLRLCVREDDVLERDLDSPTLSAWLFTVCRHRAIDLRRKEQRMHAVDSEQLDTYESEGTSPSALIDKQQRLGQIRQIIQTLPEQQQEIVVLKFQNGMTYRQISEVTSLSVSHVGVVLHHAMKAIKSQIAKQQGTALVEGGKQA